MMRECNKHFWDSFAAHYSRIDVLTRHDLGHVMKPTEVGDHISKALQGSLVQYLNKLRELNPVPAPPNKRKAGAGSVGVRVGARKGSKLGETDVVTVATLPTRRLAVSSIPEEAKVTASAPTSRAKRKRDGADDKGGGNGQHVAGGAHFRSSSVCVLCFLPAAYREPMMFCFVSICMRKECLAVLYWDAVWVLYAALLCI